MKYPVTAGLAAGIAAASLATLSACGKDRAADASAPPAQTNTNTNAGDVNPEDPAAGLNTRRPDSATDVKPEAGGQ